MKLIVKRVLLCALLMVSIWEGFCLEQTQYVNGRASDLPTTNISILWARNVASPDLSYILLDLQNHSWAARNWERSGSAVPVGSLVKPFLAIAYARSHRYKFPEHTCLPRTCWLPRGHGRVGIVQAVALSCNSYFLKLGTGVEAREVRDVAREYGLRGPPTTANAKALTGQSGVWIETPEALARAYAELLSRRSQPGVSQITDGMRESAARGTASQIGTEVPRLRVLAKTGTAPCTHTPRAPGDGFVVAAWPAESPHYLLLVREHGRPGALAARTAGRMIRDLEQQP
ncbi:MAG: hypothetical protein JO065_06970 [Acidobacteria bacterium]|nr:hypothetical protein [Acidobacteriota bacterium]